MDIKMGKDSLEIGGFDELEVLKIAMKTEEDGQKYYRSVLKKTTDERVKRTFTRLAEDEVKHFNLFNSMYEEELRARKIDPASVDTEENLFTYTDSGIFNKEVEASSVRNAIINGEEIEMKSILFYQELMKNTAHEGGKKSLAEVIEEEKMHLNILKSWEAAYPA
jgi:rubrerythrin